MQKTKDDYHSLLPFVKRRKRSKATSWGQNRLHERSSLEIIIP
jgi:hypothetical protein